MSKALFRQCVADVTDGVQRAEAQDCAVSSCQLYGFTYALGNAGTSSGGCPCVLQMLRQLLRHQAAGVGGCDADELLNVTGVKASFVMFANNAGVNISARSLGEVNVQLIMEALGGGGHQTMAACQLKNTDVIDAKNSLQFAIDNYLAQNSKH